MTALRGHAFIHPLFERGYAVFGPGFVAGHAAVEDACINVFGVRFDVGEGREVEAEIFHRVHVGSVTE
jgi:hypothetical protein